MEDNKQFIEQGITREVRFAVVMYGGVSLAIYINGIAQELLKMCRATVRGVKTEDLKTSEKIYRQISALMANEQVTTEITTLLNEAAALGDTQEDARKKNELEAAVEAKISTLFANGNPPLTKFVVDVLTGTSAGGINAIFLAKALANNQNITDLKKLWLDEGDIQVLINDKKSLDKTTLAFDGTAKSLLNSQRMYLRLLEAFDAMGADDAATESVYTEEIDLYVPTTDFQGVIVPLRLMDDVVQEKRYSQVFRFRYEKDGENDFRHNNPMLALAARATSSFPFAFEPMRLSQAVAVIEQGFEDSETKIDNLKTQAEKFFPNIADSIETIDAQTQKPKTEIRKLDWTNRDLIDGGVLDNKPFGYAIDVLTERRADFLSERKLIFIEPSPEKFTKNERQNRSDEKSLAPNVVQNAIASLSAIPSYETIREDLERLLERNKLIERVSEIIKKSEKDVYEYQSEFPQEINYAPTSGDFWETQGLEDIVRWKGLAVLPYYRLRIADLTDDITRFASVINGIEENSENFQTLRTFIKAWREDNFNYYKQNASDTSKKTVLAFLRYYDFKYRLRRLRFVQEKAVALYRFEKSFRQDLKKRKDDCRKIVAKEQTVDVKAKEEEIRKEAKIADNVELQIKIEPPLVEPSFAVSPDFADKIDPALGASLTADRKKRGSKTIEIKPSEILWSFSQQTENGREIGIEKIRAVANYFITALQRNFKKIQKRRELLFAKQGEYALKKTGMEITRENLEKIFSYFAAKDEHFTASENINREFIEKIKRDYADVFEKIVQTAAKLQTELDNSLRETRADLKRLFDENSAEIPAELAEQNIEPELFQAVKLYLKHFYNDFDDYDQISFPVFYETKVGEAVKVDVMRISPQDATDLVDERKQFVNKLSGEKLFHFGAFLDRVGRFNDILWGRLDGVERLTTAFFPDKKYANLRKYLTKKAHLEILGEEMIPSDKRELRNQFIKSLVEKSAGVNSSSGVTLTTGELIDDDVQQKIDKVLSNCLEPESAYQFLKENQKIEKPLEPKDLLRVITRSTKVTGDIFEGIADQDSLLGSKVRWVSRLGTIFWGLVEVAAPNSFWNLLFTHWITLLYFFEVVLIAASTVFGRAEIQQFATVSLILTLIIHLTAVTLGDYMRGGRFWGLIKFVAVAVFAVLTVAGGIFIFSFFYDAELWKNFAGLHEQYSVQKPYVKLFPVALLITIFAAMLTWRETANYRLRFFGVLSILFVIATVALGVTFNYLTRNIETTGNMGAVLALEFVKNKEQFFAIAGDFGNPARDILKICLALDSFVFVPLYTGFLLIFSRLFNLKNWTSKNALMRTAAALIIVTALADLSENFFTYSALDTVLADLPDWKIYGMWISASIKWLTIALATAVLSLIFWRKNWWAFFTVGFMTAAVCGIIGIFQHSFIPRFMFLQIFLLLVIGILFLIFPYKFKREF